MDLIRNFKQRTYSILKIQFPQWELGFQDTFNLFLDFNKKSVLKANLAILKSYNRITYKSFTISGNLLYNVIHWYQNQYYRLI